MRGRAAIVDFTKTSGVWRFHPSREKTRQACIEILFRLPDEVRTFIMDSKRVLLIAPGIDSPGTVSPYQFEGSPGETHHCFQVITVSPSLERQARNVLIMFIAECIATAIVPSMTPPESAHRSRAAREVKAAGKPPTPKELANSWGFWVIKERFGDVFESSRHSVAIN